MTESIPSGRRAIRCETRLALAPLYLMLACFLLPGCFSRWLVKQATPTAETRTETGFPPVARAYSREQAAADLCDQAIQYIRAGDNEKAGLLLEQIVFQPIIVQDHTSGERALREFSSANVFLQLVKLLDQRAYHAAERKQYTTAHDHLRWCRRLRRQVVASASSTNANRESTPGLVSAAAVDLL